VKGEEKSRVSVLYDHWGGRLKGDVQNGNGISLARMGDNCHRIYASACKLYSVKDGGRKWKKECELGKAFTDWEQSCVSWLARGTKWAKLKRASEFIGVTMLMADQHTAARRKPRKRELAGMLRSPIHIISLTLIMRRYQQPLRHLGNLWATIFATFLTFAVLHSLGYLLYLLVPMIL